MPVQFHFPASGLRLLAAVSWLLVLLAGDVSAQWMPLWSVGRQDGSPMEFGEPNWTTNRPPGSARARDDDFYTPGTYPSPVGLVTVQEAVTNVQRTLVESDPALRVHFVLNSSQALPTALLRLTCRMLWGGWNDLANNLPNAGFGTHDLRVLVNGREAVSHRGLRADSLLSDTFPAPVGGAWKTGENVVEIRRIGGSPGGWISFDFLECELYPTALRDSDSDGLPEHWELANGLSDLLAADAGGDLDEDGRNALDEFRSGTDPRVGDTDGDGLDDGAEMQLGTSALASDSDDDGLGDAEEGRVGTSPVLADTDGDGFTDAAEIRFRKDPTSAASRPVKHGGAIGVQFVSEMRVSSALRSNEVAGVVPQLHWNATRPLTTWNSTTGTTTLIESPRKGALVDAAGSPVLTKVQWGSANAYRSENTGSPDRRLLDGYLQANANQPAFVKLSQIPYARYDLYVYLGSAFLGVRGTLEVNRNSAGRRPFSTDLALASDGFREIQPSTSVYQRGNYMRFRNLTLASLEIKMLTEAYGAGLHGVQIVDVATDSDGDGMPDSWEVTRGLDPLVNDGAGDLDGDGLDQLGEFQSDGDPRNPDSDGDGLEDGVEVQRGSSPAMADTDADGLSDGDEVGNLLHPSDPTRRDSDGDGFDDLDEIRSRSEPSMALSTPVAPLVFSSSPAGWTWEFDSIQMVWDHTRSGAKAEPWDGQMLLSIAAYHLDARSYLPYPDIEMGLRFTKGRLTWLARCRAESVLGHNPGGEDVWRSDYADPPVDLARQLGFSGYGSHDVSARLRFRLTVLKQTGVAGLWKLSFEIHNHDTDRAVVRHEVADLRASPEVAAGTAIWGSGPGQPGRIILTTLPGADVAFTPTPVELLLGEAVRDSDSDGMPDLWETAHGLNPGNSGDGTQDLDRDGLSNVMEFLQGLDPAKLDTDADGAGDNYEVAQGSDPANAGSVPAFYAGFPFVGDDFNGNGMSDAWETFHGVSGLAAQSDEDRDGSTNLEESVAGTDPRDPSSRLFLALQTSVSGLRLEWAAQPLRQYVLFSSTNLADWKQQGTPLSSGTASPLLSRNIIPAIGTPVVGESFQLQVTPTDADRDRLPDWGERVLGLDPNRSGGMRQPLLVDTNQDGQTDLTISGDQAFLAELNGTPTNSPAHPTRIQAARFLGQATFGPTLGEVDRLTRTGIPAWIEHQIRSTPATYHEPYVRDIYANLFGPSPRGNYAASVDGDFLFGSNTLTPFGRAALFGDDQLRQRVAFALSQILVVSRRESAIEGMVLGLVNYYDLLVRHAFGSYRELLMDVSTHPVMGRYLSHVGNQKARPEINQYPDENYARELMQLFTTGLWELNPDGSRKLDSQGQPVPTYSNADITQLARVFTGFWYAGHDWGSGGYQDADFSVPMKMHATHHDFGRKEALGGLVIPARAGTVADAMRDVGDVVEHLFRHPTTPVFVSRQLIQFLVTFNPSPAYVARVQSVFVDNGRGVRGDLGAVVSAILLDPEARETTRAVSSDSFGRLKEPVVRLTTIGRALAIGRGERDFVWWNYGDVYGDTFQEPLYAPSVFSFFRPDYRPPGALDARGLSAPVLQIVDSYTSISLPNRLWSVVENGFWLYGQYQYMPDFSDWLPIAQNTAALLDRANLLLCQGLMTSRTRETVRFAVDALPRDQSLARVRLAVFLSASSPDGVLQR